MKKPEIRIRIIVIRITAVALPLVLFFSYIYMDFTSSGEYVHVLFVYTWILMTRLSKNCAANKAMHIAVRIYSS